DEATAVRDENVPGIPTLVEAVQYRFGRVAAHPRAAAFVDRRAERHALPEGTPEEEALEPVGVRQNLVGIVEAERARREIDGPAGRSDHFLDGIELDSQHSAFVLL